MVQCALDETERLEARDVLRQRDAVALGTGSFKREDAGKVETRYTRRAVEDGRPAGPADGGLSESALDWIGWTDADPGE